MIRAFGRWLGRLSPGERLTFHVVTAGLAAAGMYWVTVTLIARFGWRAQVLMLTVAVALVLAAWAALDKLRNMPGGR